MPFLPPKTLGNDLEDLMHARSIAGNTSSTKMGLVRPPLPCQLRTMKKFFLALIVLPGIAMASDRPVTADEFERIVTGKTFSYANSGAPYGAEEYLDNRRVRWTFLDGECTDGSWYAAGEHICFVYDTLPDPQCWTFYMDGGRLSARYAGQSSDTALFETERQDGPLYCLGPDVGV